MQGWFKIYRQIEDWEWYKEPNTHHLFEHLILRANVKAQRFKGKIIKRGELVTSIGHLSDQTGLSLNQVRKAISNLESTGDIVCQRGNRWTEVKVVNYHKYQGHIVSGSADFDRANNIQTTLISQSKNNPNTRIKEGKEVKKGKKKEIISEPFLSEFTDFWETYQPVGVDGAFVSKGSRIEAYKKFINLLKKGEKYENIKRGLQEYLKYCQTNAIKSCGACVFLNQKRWLDDYTKSELDISSKRCQQQGNCSKVQAIAEVVNYYKGRNPI